MRTCQHTAEATYIQKSFNRPDEVTLNSREEWGGYEVPELTLLERKKRRRWLDRDEGGQNNNNQSEEVDVDMVRGTDRGRGRRGR